MSYKLRLESFEGPLDLLLYLIKKNEVDICDIPIIEITDQYMEYIELMKELNLEVVGDFLVMAATLMQIKSKMLLPPDPEELEEPEEDPRDELVRRLQEYKQFKEIAGDLRDKEQAKQDLFSRRIDEDKLEELKEDAKETYFEASLFDLVTALMKALEEKPENKDYEIQQEEFTVEEKVESLRGLVLKQNHVSLTEVFKKARSRSEIVVTFSAVLELVRLKVAQIVQKRLFSDIELVKNEHPEEQVAPQYEAPSQDA